MSAAAYDYATNDAAERPCEKTGYSDDEWVLHLQNVGWEETTETILGEEDRCEEDNRGFYARTMGGEPRGRANGSRW